MVYNVGDLVRLDKRTLYAHSTGVIVSMAATVSNIYPYSGIYATIDLLHNGKAVQTVVLPCHPSVVRVLPKEKEAWF